MLRSLFSGITGLRSHQTMMDVVGNNIANVNTTGYKTSSAVFEDTLSQLMRSAGAPANGRGGVNPTQIGLGVQMGGITTNFTQGSAQNTGRVTDLMIQGDGFFVLNKGGEQVYSRAGAFTFDNSGRLVNNQGMVVQGWLATPAPETEDGTPGSGLVMNTNVAVTDIIIPANTVLAPAASTSVTLAGNISVGTTGVMTMVTVSTVPAGHALSIIVTPNEDGTEFEIDVGGRGERRLQHRRPDLHRDRSPGRGLDSAGGHPRRRRRSSSTSPGSPGSAARRRWPSPTPTGTPPAACSSSRSPRTARSPASSATTNRWSWPRSPWPTSTTRRV